MTLVSVLIFVTAWGSRAARVVVTFAIAVALFAISRFRAWWHGCGWKECGAEALE